MTLQQTLQANDGRTKELFDRLEDTSDQAVKTRENLFSELSHELRLHADLEQRHLFPALRSNDDTRELVPDAARLNKELRAKIDEIEALPKGDSSFRPRLAELRKLYQQQTSTERRELVPAARKALGDEEANAVAEKIEAKRAQVEEQQRAEAEERREAAKREGEHNRAVAARKRAAEEVVDAAKLNARDLRKSAAEAVHNGAKTARETSEKAVETGTEAARRARDEASEAARKLRDNAKDSIGKYRETARERGADLKALANAIRNFADVSSGVRSVVVNHFKHSGRVGLETSKQFLRNPRKAGELQREYVTSATRNLLESTEAILQILRSASQAGRQPVEERLRASA